MKTDHTAEITEELVTYLPSGRKTPARFSIRQAQKKLLTAQQREFELEDKRMLATRAGQRLGPRLERQLETLRERIDQIRHEILSLEEQRTRGVR